MNARAGKLVAALRGIASTLPKTNSIGFYVSVAFGLVLTATWQRERGDVWVDLAGPHHMGTPPRWVAPISVGRHDAARSTRC